MYDSGSKQEIKMIEVSRCIQFIYCRIYSCLRVEGHANKSREVLCHVSVAALQKQPKGVAMLTSNGIESCRPCFLATKSLKEIRSYG